MFVQFKNGSIVTGPQSEAPLNDKGTIADDWYPYIRPGLKTSRLQTLSVVLVENVVYGEWLGSADPLDEPVINGYIRTCGLLIMEYPLATSSGEVFQFDAESERAMTAQVKYLLANPGETIPWVLLDNSTVTVNAANLQGYLAELSLLKATRMATIFAEYRILKNSGTATERDLKAWRESYIIT